MTLQVWRAFVLEAVEKSPSIGEGIDRQPKGDPSILTHPGKPSRRAITSALIRHRRALTPPDIPFRVKMFRANFRVHLTHFVGFHNTEFPTLKLYKRQAFDLMACRGLNIRLRSTLQRLLFFVCVSALLCAFVHSILFQFFFGWKIE